MKINQAVQKLLVGDRQTDIQTGDLISLVSFLESRLKLDLKWNMRIWMDSSCSVKIP
jgi:hypothetical protein